MKNLTMSAFGLLVIGVLYVGTASAQSPHFIYANGSLDKAGDYVASFKEVGLGNTPITYVLSAATATFTYQCFTRSNNTPQGSPNSVSFCFSNESTSSTITPRNGQITGGLTLSPEQDGASCQGHGPVLKLVAVDYEGVTLCDTTDNVCVNLPNESATARF